MPQVVVEDAAVGRADDIERPGDRKGSDRRAARQA